MMALWATKLSIGLDDDKPVACLVSARTEIQLYLHGKKGGENVRRAKSQEGPRADSRHGTDPQRRSFLSARSLDERRSGRSAGSNISRTVETFPFFSPEAAAGEIAFCNFKASCRRSCGGVMELEGKVNCCFVGDQDRCLDADPEAYLLSLASPYQAPIILLYCCVFVARQTSRLRQALVFQVHWGLDMWRHDWKFHVETQERHATIRPLQLRSDL
ncbi:unnamed protein product [Cylindrotheca closterium]|uniref:Uncharacterized protein n=1 Tax=Cylindrotheca closterium TaxID=2856 RepID=A0AAD2G8M2_9STRA|nr:unnamed protein product [Cylindrotheca closterium]